MTEDEAQHWLKESLNVSRETWERLDAFVEFLKVEASQQNLISAATLQAIWTRHIVDSAQLLDHVPEPKRWLDLGTGAGFPGLIVALLSNHNVTLVESRAKRVEYLQRTIDLLGLASRTRIAHMPVERLETATYDIISARAFAPLPRLLDLAARFSTAKTLWLLPKGRNAVKELHEAHGRWQLDFAVKPSITDDQAGILVGHVLGERLHGPVKGKRKQ